MAKLVTLLLISILLCSCTALSMAGRPEPLAVQPQENPARFHHHEGFPGAEQGEVVEESCEGVGEEECLMRRTLAAHIDYIYTQKHKP